MRAGKQKTIRRKNSNIFIKLLGLLLLVLVALLRGIGNLLGLIGGFFKSLEPRAKLAAAAGGAVLLGMAVLLFAIFIMSRPNAYIINLNGDFIGIVEMRGHPELTRENVMELVVRRLEQEVTEPVRCFDDISVEPVRSRDFKQMDLVVSDIARRANFRVQVAVITVDGDSKAIVKNEDEARRLLNDILNEYWQDDRLILFNDFIEHVEVILDFMDISNRMTYNTARSILTTPSRVEDVHSVVSGENLTSIRLKYDMSEDFILSLNPGIRPHNLSIGQELIIMRPKALVSVRTVAQQITVEPVKFEVLTHDDPSRPRNYSNVVTQGRDGSRAVTEHLIYENGILISREEVGWTYIEEPIPQQVVRGTGS